MENDLQIFVQTAGQEDVSRREANVKHFDLGANRYQAVAFAEPVHFRASEAEEWQEIDNTLEEAVTAQGRRVLCNRASRIRMEFPREADSGNMVSIMDGDRTFAWRFEQEPLPVQARIRTGQELSRERLIQTALRLPEFAGRTAESLTDAELAGIETEQERRADIATLRAEVLYENLRPGVSVRYTLNGESLKEDIVLTDVDALAKAGIQLPKEFNYAVTEGRRLLVTDKDTGVEHFYMNAPYVYDAAGTETVADILLTDCGEYMRMAYSIDAAFMAKAVYPVTIDPVVQTATTNSAVCDSYIWKKNPNTNYGTVHLMRCGDGEGGESLALIKFNKLIKIKASDTILSAKLRVSAKNYASTNEHMACYPIKTAWTETGVTWNQMTPSNDTHINPCNLNSNNSA